MSDAALTDTIAAIATAPGRGAVALIRIAGPQAVTILERVAGSPPGGLTPRVQTLLPIQDPEREELLDRALVTHFPAPSSYTGDDVVEISTHGGVLTPQLVLSAVVAAGARAALPGEFTRRAYLNGKLDLLQAEAVLDLIDGRSPAFHRAAIHQLDRGLSERIESLRSSILALEALLIYSIDFPEEDEPPVPPERIEREAADVLQQLDRLLSTAPEGEMLREGALVVLAGRPNAGKSSLFNALLGAERAIVTEIPGTTRDALEAQLTVEGYPFRLVDTAGLRRTADRVESLGIEVARRYLQAAQMVLFCAPAGRQLDPEEREFLGDFAPERTIVVRTMRDLADASYNGQMEHHLSGRAIEVSAITGTGLEGLRSAMLEVAFGEILEQPGDSPIVTRQRHVRALREAHSEVEEFRKALAGGVPIEIAAVHLRSAVAALEDVIGVISTEDLLGRVFGEFCVGK